MLADQVAVASEPPAINRVQESPHLPAPRRPRWGFRLLVLLIVVAGGIGGVYVATSGDKHSGESAGKLTTTGGRDADSLSSEPKVEVVKPHQGGMARVTNQPGTINAFEFAKLYAKISGYLEELNVDRGSRVKKGEVLAELYVPELKAAVEQAKAAVVRANAAVDQAKARVTSAEKTIEAKQALQEKAVADVQAAVAERDYRNKQYNRIDQLVKRHAVEERLRDEEIDHYHVALSLEHSANAAVATAKAEVAEARALLAQAMADLEGAKADVKVNDANLAKEQALYQYTKIKSPYTGVVIYRGEAVHRGSFIQSPDRGAMEAMLTVAFDDTMRTIIPIPDRDVPYCNVGDPATIRIDAMGDREFKGKVSRMAESEDPQDRTMRVEVDLPNPDHILRDGMFGRGEIILEKDTSNLTVPSSCVLEKNSKGEGAVQVVKDGKTYKLSVQIGRDDGVRAEILSGLSADSLVILQPDASIADGTKVQVESETAPAA
jgi:HlyD family secretion protein